jgi:quercetin 2,3-dioxygenase
MISLRPADQRGHAQLGWLDSYHSFSFGDYHDPKYMGFRALRVINEDRVQPGRGFGTHSHRDMEIISYVLEGALEHKDSMGTGSVIVPGDVQIMTAGTGVSHSEFNHSKTDLVHFLQIWILPERPRLTPSYEQKSFSREERRGELRLVAARDGRGGALTVHQDVALYASLLDPGERKSHTIERGHAWVQVAQGAVTVNGTALRPGDGAAVSGEKTLEIQAIADAEILVFDLA